MIDRIDLKQEPSCGRYWTSVLNGSELFFEPIHRAPDDDELNFANTTLSCIENLYKEAIDYIDVWVDRSKEGVGLENELHSIFINKESGYTKLEIHFVEDDESLWWVHFTNPEEKKNSYWPQEFGRKQM